RGYKRFLMRVSLGGLFSLEGTNLSLLYDGLGRFRNWNAPATTRTIEANSPSQNQGVRLTCSSPELSSARHRSRFIRYALTRPATKVNSVVTARRSLSFRAEFRSNTASIRIGISQSP